MLAAILAVSIAAQEPAETPALPRQQFRSGEAVLKSFASISQLTRNSIVKFNVDGSTVALGAVVDTNGLAMTKASEIKKGKLTCWLATEEEVDAEVLAVDSEEDVALVRVRAIGLKPIRWAKEPVAIGEWAITPGIAETPHAVGIISAVPHRVRPQRALIGVRFDSSSQPKVEEIQPGFGAERAGIKPGDIIAGVNGTLMTNREQVVEILRDFRDGQEIRLTVRRDGKDLDFEVQMRSPKPGELPMEIEPPSRTRLSGDVSQRAQGFEQAIEHDTVLPPWLCGGPVVNLEGHAIGLNIARAGRVTTYALPASLVLRIFDHLKSAQKHKAESKG